MNLEIRFGGATRLVEVTLGHNRVSASIDGRSVEADAVEVSPGTYSILMGGQSFEVYVEPSAAGLRTHLLGRSICRRSAILASGDEIATPRPKPKAARKFWRRCLEKSYACSLGREIQWKLDKAWWSWKP